MRQLNWAGKLLQVPVNVIVTQYCLQYHGVFFWKIWQRLLAELAAVIFLLIFSKLY